MHRSRRAHLEPDPWIEQLILDYGAGESKVTVRANVIGVSDLSESQKTDCTAACMLFLSDGHVSIPAIVSEAAWEHLQEMEERETFSGLENTTVCVHKFRLDFHSEPELTCCQFYLTVNQLSTTGRTTNHNHTPTCTTLPSVKQHILKTWRSLQKECSINSGSTQSGLSLSCLMGAWHNDIISPFLNDAMERLNAAHLDLRSVATPTHWQRERLRWKAEVPFTVNVSHLLIPEEQREIMAFDLSSNMQADTHTEFCEAQNGERDLPTVAADESASDNQEHPAQETLDGGVGSVGLSQDKVSPWDMFCPAPDLISSSSSEASVTSEPLPQQQSQSLVTSTNLEPLATSTQQCSNYSEAKSGSSLTPYQKLCPAQASPKRNSVKRLYDVTDEEWQLKEPTPSPPTWMKANISPSVKQRPATALCTTKRQVHSDGSVFSYSYRSSPQVSSLLGQFKIPDPLMQWSVRYLATTQPPVTSDASQVNR